MKYVWNVMVNEPCDSVITVSECNLLRQIIKMKNNYKDYCGELFIVKNDACEYFLRVEENFSADGFECRFGLHGDIRAAMQKYGETLLARVKSELSNTAAHLEVEDNWMCVCADYSLDAPAWSVKEFVDICDKFYQEQLNARKEIGSEFTKDEYGYSVKAGTLHQICSDILHIAEENIDTLCRVSEYYERGLHDGVKVDVHEDRGDFYNVYVGDYKLTPPFLADISDELTVSMLELQLKKYFKQTDGKFFLRVIK